MLFILALAGVGWGQHNVSYQKQLASAARQWDAVQRQLASAEKQRAAAVPVRAQPAGAVPAANQPPADIGGCEPLVQAEAEELIGMAAEYTGLTHELLRAVIDKESAFKPCAVSSKGAQGLMQLMPEVSRAFGIVDPFDPHENVGAGSKLLKNLVTRFGGDLRLALAAYNAGLGRVEKEGGVPRLPETENYVGDILRKLGIE
jgi:soluble lytic murein transglycosylase-like protein